MNLQSLLKDLEFEESLCCSTYALYNLLRSYPETLFDREAPVHEDFARGLGRMAGVAAIGESHGLSDRSFDAIAKGLGLKGQAAELPGSEAELRKLLSAPGTGCLVRLHLRDGSESVAGVRHSLLLLPVESDRKPPHYEALDSNAAIGETAHFSWKDLSRILCGVYQIEVHGPRRETGNAVPGFGAKKDLDRRPRRPDITALRKALAEFAMNSVMGLEALESAMLAHPKSGVLRVFRASVQLAMSVKPTSSTRLSPKAIENLREGFVGEAKQDLAEALRLEPGLREALPLPLSNGHWQDSVEAFSTLGVLAVSPKDGASELSEEVQKRLRSHWQ